MQLATQPILGRQVKRALLRSAPLRRGQQGFTLVEISIVLVIIGLILGFVLAYMYSKLKSGKHPGMATHLMYWFTGAPSPKELPASHIRELNG